MPQNKRHHRGRNTNAKPPAMLSPDSEISFRVCHALARSGHGGCRQPCCTFIHIGQKNREEPSGSSQEVGLRYSLFGLCSFITSSPLMGTAASLIWKPSPSPCGKATPNINETTSSLRNQKNANFLS